MLKCEPCLICSGRDEPSRGAVDGGTRDAKHSGDLRCCHQPRVQQLLSGKTFSVRQAVWPTDLRAALPGGIHAGKVALDNDLPFELSDG